MQPILTVVVSAVGFAITLWVVRRALRSIFRTQAQNSLSVVLISAGIWLLVFRAVTVAIPLLILGTVLLLLKSAAMVRGSTTQTSKV